ACRNIVNSSATGDSFLPRCRIWWKSRVTLGLISRLEITLRFRNAIREKEGIIAIPSPASTKAICVSDKFTTLASCEGTPACSRGLSMTCCHALFDGTEISLWPHKADHLIDARRGAVSLSGRTTIK